MKSRKPDAALDEVQGLRKELESEIRFSSRIYCDVSAILDEKLGTEEEDGTGEGLAGDVLLAINAAHAAGYAEGVARVKAAVESSLVNEPICDLYPDDDPATCGWKQSVQCVVSALASVEGDDR